ncbi:hypothetical protein B0T26DRAFT_406950 [Lasiosphaeria miniovina]|uniref:CHY-type domain-containing protein n=1 Tax=Lasiosphaeria miniovina TaxID=1954250 RepID=A0AA40DQF3_9PEZI|nr:uncharacterized protein B0T26DRAFT_406950 [Lasiosphaeria miniovina]KAK0709462.1 hypothetical protein B0T26DRAFT_406950 [Lasiosphaeria miniovina]
MIPIRPKDGVSPRSTRQAVGEAPASRVVPKPIPERQFQDARGYQIRQLTRRFSPMESNLGNGGTSLVFSLTPSDPDFPFELDQLRCDLRVPAAYPAEPPRLLVKNTEIPKGFAINIEQGWDKLVQEKRGATLLALTNALDKRLESFLAEEKAETVKLVIFKDTRHVDFETAPEKQTAPVSPKPSPPARMGRQPVYHKSSDGIVYTLPLEPKRRANLPVGLRPVQSIQLIIPLLYPLQPLRLLLNDVESHGAEPVEELFSQKATEQKQMSLTSHLNYLAQNFHDLAKQAQTQRTVAEKVAVEVPPSPGKETKEVKHSPALDSGKGHIHFIQRPPEWADVADSKEIDSSDAFTCSDDDDDDDEEEEADGGATVQAESSNLPTQTLERGTAMSFPSIELHGIDLLHVSVLSISVKCARCKTLNEIGGLKDNLEKSSSCKKCATSLTVKFRQELVHQNSTRAGFIDASGCTVADILPSTFVPTCSTCSTPYQQGLTSVRGEVTTNVCRECHGRFTFKIPDIKFIAYAPGMSGQLPPTSGPRRRQDKLGLHVGEPLPNRGACQHYKRSFRWFRFSCCSKVYPCDKCHDDGEDGSHVIEWANRMICGFCSREQNYRVDSCAFCGRSVIGKRGNGYWEGGKGTRNQVLMRRGDKRKHRRIGGSANKGAD